jgi:branched-chain amino acid transport system substrate-binding protein
MKAIPTVDPLFGKGYIRADGRKIHPLYLLEVKKPDESQSKWDLLKVVATIPGEDAFRPEKDGGLPAVEITRLPPIGGFVMSPRSDTASP